MIDKEIKERQKEKNQGINLSASSVDNYGGSYINSEGKLTVLVCDKDKFIIEKCTNQKTKLTANVQEDIDIEKTYDYQQLVTQDTEYKTSKFTKDYIDKIYNFASKHMGELNINSVVMSETNNIVKIGIADMNNAEKITNYFLQNITDFDRDSVEFYIVDSDDEYTFKSSTSFPGRRVYKLVNSRHSEGTCGFNAKDKNTGKYGIVTAAHGVKTGEEVHNNNGTVIGKATTWQLSKKIDAVFVPYGNSNVTQAPTYKIDGSSSNVISGYVKVADIKEGASVVRYGFESGSTSCKITSVNVSQAIEGISLSGLVKLSCVSVGGDSGGPVVSPVSGPVAAGKPSTNKLVGIVTAGSYYDTLITKAGYVLATFDLSLYSY